ncbi:putative zinc finger motif, C2HC5-type-domain-containing protein [Podospora fimiseda]|uniref:Zinc finger motif, C2HC5-type-domain-containing protein n=1 Tax=Podospora fimiseda TaxID=252190 RepID=A0AAN7BP87_9PEZI|nr:putative zinc finger motif, C2HC5-type-domain-containing protein [Podospora fimiseda]
MSKEQLFQLLPMPDDGLQQVLEYAATLSKAEAAEHFSNMLGDSPQVIEFISTFNARRSDPKPAPAPTPSSSRTPITTAPSSAQTSEVEGVPKNRRGPKKKKAIHTPPPRQVASFALGPGTVYNKKDQNEEYIASKPSRTSTPSSSGPTKPPPPQPSSKPPPSAAGALISDLPKPKSDSKSSNPPSRTSTPGPSSKNNTTKISITGGTPMHGSSTIITDLDLAIRSLEISTDPKHTSNTPEGISSRRCNCVGTRHPPFAASPNCLNCGKVICIKEGPGPCTFCHTPLLSSQEIQSIIRELKAERGREKMAVDRELHKKPTPSFAKPGQHNPTLAEAQALAHRDKLLAFQAQNAKRTTVRDEAADFDVMRGGNMWATPEERAMELKRQQKLLREMEWSAKPEYEKRQQIVSIDLTGKKVLKKTVKIERPPTPQYEKEEEDDDIVGGYALDNNNKMESKQGTGGGTFSKNPLLKGVIRPVWDPKGKGAELEGRKDRAPRWRRVQDDLDDNEGIILDGGVYGGGKVVGAVGDEPACG